MTRKIPFFLIIKESGAVRTTKNRPQLESDEVSIGLTLELPAAIFRRPQLQATIKIGEDAVQMPELSVEQIDNVKEAIEQGLGLGVTLRVEEPNS